MTDNLPADQKRRQRLPAEPHKQQEAGEKSLRTAEGQVRRNNTAGNKAPAALHGRQGAPANARHPVPSRQQAASGGKRPVNAAHAVPASRKQVQRPVPKRPEGNRIPESRTVTERPAAERPVQKRPVKKAPAARTQVQKEPAQKIPVRPFILFGVFMLIVAVVVTFLFFVISEETLIKNKVTVEVGTSASFDMFIESEPKYPQYLSTNLDFASIDYSKPQSVYFIITLYGIDHDCELVVADTVPPKGEAVPQELMSVDQIPDAEKCVTNIEDKTPVTVTWADTPDISSGGEFVAAAKLTDLAGNETIVYVPLSVTRDSVAPEITGYRDISIILGESISYRSGITVTDNYDKNPKLEIDTSGVRLDKAGDYQAVLKATDFTGNTTEVKINVKIKPKPKNYVEPDVVYAQAKEVLNKIITPGMTDMEKALQIVWWVRYNIRFNLRIKPKSWTEGAYNAFREKRGNCLSSASCVKAMLDVEGIENMFVTRWPYKVAKHYWNYVKIDGQWYHCDATWRQNYDSYFFMYTTKELLAFWHDGWNGFEFDQKKYPESATGSVQKKIDYRNHKIKS